jgi:hypothetical protein
VVCLVPCLSEVSVPADPALIDESSQLVFIKPLLLRLKHVIALLAEAHTLKSHVVVSLLIIIFKEIIEII